MPSNNKFAKILFTSISIGFVLFVFSNSMYPGPESSKKSQFALNVINMLNVHMGISIPITEHIVRKLGHFTEYFILGNLLTLTVRMYVKRPIKYIFIELFSLLAVPVLDEFLQTFIQGRSGNVGDVILDFMGGLVGMLVCMLLIYRIDAVKTHVKNGQSA